MAGQTDKPKKPLKRALKRNNAPLDHAHFAHEELYRYLDGLRYSGYEQSDFDKLLDAAKDELKQQNYLHDEKRGFLADEAKGFILIFKTIPLFMSFLAALGLLALTFLRRGAESGLPAQLALAGAVTLGAIALTLAVRPLFWRALFDHNRKGDQAVRRIRDFNKHVLTDKFKALQRVVSERAKNDDPERGATGNLQSNLIFISGYVLQKAVHRCHTRFAQYLDEVEIPSVDDVRRIWFIGAAAALFAGAASWTSGGGHEAVLAYVALPFLAGWIVFAVTSGLALRKGSPLQQRRALLRDAYLRQPSPQLLKACNLNPGQEEQLVFPVSYDWNGAAGYAEWLHSILQKYDNLKNRRYPDG